MVTKSGGVVGAATIVLAGIVFLLSTVAMSSNQDAPTPTSTLALTNTPLPTATFTATPINTPTFTPSPTSTPAYPSASEIRQTLKSDFDQINARLDGISQKTEPSHLVNIVDNLISNGIWALLVAVASFLGLARIFIGARARRSGTESPDSKYDNLAGPLNLAFIFILVMLIAYFLIPMLLFVGQTTMQAIGQVQLDSISQKLDRIENQLNGQPQVTPPVLPNLNYSSNSPTNNIPDWQFPLGASIAMLAFFMGVAVVISRNQAKIYGIEFFNVDWQQVGRKLLPAVFLILVLDLLPYPIDTFLLPILIPFFMFAFFDVVTLLPNQHLKRLVVRHYSLIIFIAVFGVWNGVFEFIQRIAYPIWNGIDSGFQSAIESFIHNPNVIQRPSFISQRLWEYLPYSLPYFAWEWLPLILALFFAIIPWRQIRKIAKEKYIPKIADSFKPQS